VSSALPQSQGQALGQGNVTVLHDKGLIQALEGNYSGALSLCKIVLTIDPYDYNTFSSIGQVVYRLHITQARFVILTKPGYDRVDEDSLGYDRVDENRDDIIYSNDIFLYT